MRSWPPRRVAALLALSLLGVSSVLQASPLQDDASATAVLRSRARTLEQRGRPDLARQDWSQLLTLEPNDAEAMAGLVRAARAEGRTADAATLLNRLRSAHPQAPELAQLEQGGGTADASSSLRQAAQLARSGDARAAMAIYHRLYGQTPPAGPQALAFYETESATEEGRPHAVAGLRALADQFPTEARYQVALGRVLLQRPRTRAEGQTLLERFPDNAEALAALHGTAVPVQRAEAARPQSERPGLKEEGAGTPLQASSRPAENSGGQASAPLMHTASAHAATSQRGTAAAEEASAFAALNAHRAEEAESRFQAILRDHPADPRALAGLGYLSSSKGDLKAAVNYFERAQEGGDRSLALTRALVNAQFELALQQANAARTSGDLTTAEARYRAILQERPNEPEALDGLGSCLLQSGRTREAAPIFARLTRVRPMSPAAWRGSVIAQADLGDAAGALATDARVPQDARAPLAQDPAYLQALSLARSRSTTEVARGTPATAPPAPLGGVVARQQAPAPQPLPPGTTVTAPRQPAPGLVPAPNAPPPSPPAAAMREAGKAAPNSTSVPSRPQTAARQNTTVPPPAGVSPSAPQTSEAKPTANSRATRVGGRNARATAPAMARTAPPAPPPLAAPVSPVVPPDEAVARERTAQGMAALARGENGLAASLLREAANRQPDRPEPWRGMVLAYHAAGQEREAVAAYEAVPAPALTVLRHDATFLDAAGTALNRVGRPDEALRALAEAQEIFSTQRLPPPLELVLRVANLLAARGDDANLYRELMYLGGRQDLSAPQRQQVQMIWTGWAVRRGRVLAAAGERRRAVVVLNAAVESFPGNPQVLDAVASGYAGIGLPREAVALYRAEDLTQASVRQLQTAVDAAVAARDFKAASEWVRLGRERFPADAEMLTTAAEYEQARGHEQRAVDLSRQAKALAPVQDPAQVLTAELREAPAGVEPLRSQGGQLAVLLAPDDAISRLTVNHGGQPFLPATAGAIAAGGGFTAVPQLQGYSEPAH